MSDVPSVSERLSTIVTEKPIYSAQHNYAALALLRLVDYDHWSLSEFDWLLSVEHAVHLRIDALVQQYGMYKVGCHGGIFTIAANVSGEVDKRVPETLLRFAKEAMRHIEELPLPNGDAITLQVALSAGPLRSAILGKTALKYTVHGRSEVLARRLLQNNGQNGRIVATKEFVDCLDSGRVSWVYFTPKKSCQEVNNDEEYYLYDDDPERTLSATSTPTTLHHQNLVSKLLSLVPSLCFKDPERERCFRLFQADRFSSFDILYMSLCISTAMAAFSRALRNDYVFSAARYLAPSIVGTVTPLVSAVVWPDLYRRHRHRFLALFRATKLLSLGLFGFPLQYRIDSLPPTLLTCAVLNGLHAIGTQLLLPFHLVMQVLSVMVIAMKSISRCQSLESAQDVQECNPVTASLVLFIVSLLIPSFIAYKYTCVIGIMLLQADGTVFMKGGEAAKMLVCLWFFLSGCKEEQLR